MSEAQSQSLAGHYDGIVCDLDGVVYRGPDAVDHAIEALDDVRDAGLRIAFATNNASRPPAQVAEHLRGLGLTLDESAVVTSSQAGARHLAGRLPAGAQVLAVGGEGVGLALAEVGLTPVLPADAARGDSDVSAVLQGLGAQVSWTDLAEAAYAIQAGALWVATNADTTLPNDRGTAPGNGALVGAVRHAVGTDPVVVGKPQPPLYELSAQVLGTRVERTLAIGDRLDTDLEGAVNTGMDGLFVLTGVSRLRDVCLADPGLRPTHLAVDLRALHEEYVVPTVQTGEGARVATCAAAKVRLDNQGYTVVTPGDGSHLLRCVVALAWQVLDAGDDPDLARCVRAVTAVEWSSLEERVLAGAGRPR